MSELVATFTTTTSNNTWLLSLFFLSLTLIITCHARSNGGRRARTIPGPAGWPVVGSLPVVLGSVMHRRLAALSSAHGAGRLMSLSLGAAAVVVSSHPDTAREILSGPAFRDRPARAAARALMFGRAVGFAPAGDYWRRLRRTAGAGMLSPRRVAALEPLRRRIADDMANAIADANGNAMALRGVLQRASLEAMVGSVLGLNNATNDLDEMLSEAYNLVGVFNLGDYYKSLGGVLDFFGVGPRCKRLAIRVRELFGKVIEEKRRRSETLTDGTHDQRDDDLLSYILSLPKEEGFEDADVIAVVWEMIFRGTDVIAILLEWAMARMTLHPEIQAKAQQELDTYVGPRPIKDSDVPNLRYLQCIIKETLRMHPPGPLLSWARLAVQDTHVGKYFVPAGTTAMVNMWAIAHDESIWKDPWAFQPERFLEEDVSVMGSDLRLAPFGSGRRVCPGRVLGLTTVHLWLGRLLQEYKWSPAKSVKVTEKLRLSMEMKKPLVCRATIRRRAIALR